MFNPFKKKPKEEALRCYDNCEVVQSRENELSDEKLVLRETLDKLEAAQKQLEDTKTALEGLQGYTEELEQTATELAMGAPVIVNGTMSEDKLKALKSQVEAVPDSAQFRGTASYIEKGKETIIEMKSKSMALNLIERALRGEIQISSL